MTRNGDDEPHGGPRSFFMETRVGSTTPLGCIVQIVGAGLAAALLVWLVMTFA